jgi:hypothetical protein
VRRCATTASVLASSGSTASTPLDGHHRDSPDYGSSIISMYLQHPSTTADARVPPRGNGKETSCSTIAALCLCRYSNHNNHHYRPATTITITTAQQPQPPSLPSSNHNSHHHRPATGCSNRRRPLRIHRGLSVIC